MTRAARRDDDQEDDGNFVRSLERGLAVIRSFGPDRERMAIADVAREIGLTRGAARRFLMTLEDLGYIKQEGRLFSLTPKTLDLGYEHFANQPWWQHAQSVAQHVASQIGNPCAIGVLEELSALYVCYAAPEIAGGRSPSKRGHEFGVRLPAYAAAMGRILMTSLSEPDLLEALKRAAPAQLTPHTETSPAAIAALVARARETGHSFVDQELEVGLCSLSVPVLDRSGRVFAAISISFSPEFAPSEDAALVHLPMLQAASTEVSKSLPV